MDTLAAIAPWLLFAFGHSERRTCVGAWPRVCHSLGMRETNLAPGFLLAMPQLADPNFARSVVLMLEHNDAGSFGLVINHPSQASAREVLDELSIEWTGPEDAVAYRGGPVRPGTGWVLHEPVAGWPPPDGRDGTIEITRGIWLSTSMDRLRALVADAPTRLRIVLGYSGWGAGQLAKEMTEGSWLHADVNPELVFETPDDMIWSQALRSLGIANPDSIVAAAGVH